MKNSKQYAKMLKDAHEHGLGAQHIELLKDCMEMAVIIETAAKQTFEADAMTVLKEAVKAMREAD